VATNTTCVGAVQTNVLRISRLTSTFHIDAGASNLYTTDSVIEIVSNPIYGADTDLEQQNGSGDVCVSFSRDGTYKRHDLTMSLCTLDAQLLELLANEILVTSGGNDIGSRFNTEANDQWVCLEAWQSVVEDGSTTGEYVHWIWPKCQFRRGQTTRNNGILTVPLSGKAFFNPNIGLGPAGDWPTTFKEPDSWYIDSSHPAAQCQYQSAATGS